MRNENDLNIKISFSARARHYKRIFEMVKIPNIEMKCHHNRVIHYTKLIKIISKLYNIYIMEKNLVIFHHDRKRKKAMYNLISTEEKAKEICDVLTKNQIRIDVRYSYEKIKLIKYEEIMKKINDKKLNDLKNDLIKIQDEIKKIL
jgi:hypothetical protein